MRKTEQQASELSREKEADCSAENRAASIRVKAVARHQKEPSEQSRSQDGNQSERRRWAYKWPGGAWLRWR